MENVSNITKVPEKTEAQSRKTPVKKSKYMSASQFKFTFLTEPFIEQANFLYTSSFILMNNLWKKMANQNDYANIISLNRNRIIACMRGGWCTAMFMDTANSSKELVAVSPCIDLVDYLTVQANVGQSQFLDLLARYGGELERQYFEQILLKAKRGTYVYSYGGTTLAKYANIGITKKFWSIGLIYLKLAGYKSLFLRATNRITTKVILSFGGSIVKVLHITEPGIQNQFMELIRVNLDQLSFDSLGKYYEDADPQASIDMEEQKQVKEKILRWGGVTPKVGNAGTPRSKL